MEEEQLGLEAALRAVLADNLFGLEIDPRCTQIAAFNVALTSWKLAAHPIELPPLHIACSGLAVGATKNEWLTLAGNDQRLRGGMERLYDLFEKAAELGSLIDPCTLKTDLLQADFAALQPLIAAALGQERTSDEQTERVVVAQGMSRAAELLAGRYALVITNVPYRKRADHKYTLRAFADEHHREARADLATIFLSRILRWLGPNGAMAVVAPQNWLYQIRYRTLREELLGRRTWHLVARLGPGAFETIGGHVVNVALCLISATEPGSDALIAGLDASSIGTPHEKAVLLRGEAPHRVRTSGPGDAEADAPSVPAADAFDAVESGPTAEVAVQAYGAVSLVAQARQLKNPDARVSLSLLSAGCNIADLAIAMRGIVSGDGDRWIRTFWEIPTQTIHSRGGWRLQQSTVRKTEPYSGREHVIDWSGEGGGMLRPGTENQAYGKDGVAVSQIGQLPVTLYTGELYDNNTGPIVPHDRANLPALWCFCSSRDFADAIRRIDRALKVTNASLIKVPFDLAVWQEIAAEKYPNGLPEPHSDDPTQWLFHGHPGKAKPQAVLQVAVARLLGYHWPPEHDREMRLAAEARACIEQCLEMEAFASGDGIVCLPALRGEAAGADILRRLLGVAFGDAWSAAKERELLAGAAGDGKPVASLEEWLRDRFFEDHCKLFHHRPFVWHVWDRRRDGFHALVNYHRLAGPNGEGRRTLEALTYSYLGDWIERQKAEQREGVEGADARLAAAQDLQTQLERILIGEPPCDIFVRWKPLHLQPIGWDPDINDGVRINIRPFLFATLRTGGRKGAGILRWKPNINWNKDRGKEPQSLRPKADFPWFWGCPGEGAREERTDFAGDRAFDGNRWNDLHYTNAARRAARERAGGEAGRG
jgi:hypothetical protein